MHYDIYIHLYTIYTRMTEIVSLINPDIQIVERIVYVVRYCPSEAQRRAIKKYQE
jgi:hypothetical protein